MNEHASPEGDIPKKDNLPAASVTLGSPTEDEYEYVVVNEGEEVEGDEVVEPVPEPAAEPAPRPEPVPVARRESEDQEIDDETPLPDSWPAFKAEIVEKYEKYKDIPLRAIRRGIRSITGDFQAAAEAGAKELQTKRVIRRKED